MYIEANVHGNEIQGAEVALYTVWYLMENYGRIDQITKLVNERVFYVVPTVNPDGRDHFLKGTGAGARTGHVPVDDDNDGAEDEDGDDDLNGNGVIEQIRKYVPGQGTHRKSARGSAASSSPRRRARPATTCSSAAKASTTTATAASTRIRSAATTATATGRPTGSRTTSRAASMDYPFQLPEAKAVNDFLMTHPNIAGVQSYHNNGGMILRGPGAEWQGEYPAADVARLRRARAAGRADAAVLPLPRDLERPLHRPRRLHRLDQRRPRHAVVLERAVERRPVLQQPRPADRSSAIPNSPINDRVAQYFFDDMLEFGDQYVEWKEFDHPQFGKVEMGGWKKTQGRVPPRFMNEELCHRNMAFSLYQADEMPQMKSGETKVEAIGGGVYRVRVDFTNPKLTPTILAKAAQNNVVRPDLLTVEGAGIEVLSAGWVASKFRPGATELIDQQDPKRILLRTGHAGRTTRTDRVPGPRHGRR